MFLLCSHAPMGNGQELFPSNKSKSYERGETLDSNATIGGRVIYRGGRVWQIANLSTVTNNMDMQFGTVELVSFHEGDFFLGMAVTSALTSPMENGYFSADLCSPSNIQLVKVSKAVGLNDNCLLIQHHTIKTYNQAVPGLLVTVRNSKSSWRLYEMRLFVNLALIGYANSTADEWSLAGVQKDTGKLLFVERMEQWAKTVQDGVDRGLDFSKPATAFDGIEGIESIFKPRATGNRPIVARYSNSPNSSIQYTYCGVLERMINPAEEQCH